MLQFFRRHQKILFYVVTFFIVCSFVFFGTYQTFSATKRPPDPTVFTTQDGRKIKRSYFEKMRHFLAHEPTFSSDPRKLIGANPLNDGVVSKEILGTKLGYAIVRKFQDKIAPELEERLGKEKQFRAYAHPHLAHLQAVGIWQQFAPGINENLALLQKSASAFEEKSFAARAALYQAENHFPAEFLQQVMRYHEQQYGPSSRDYALQNGNFALFGYADLTDWFGTAFMDGATMSIIEGAALARSRGYKVTREEAQSDLYTRCQTSYAMIKDRVQLPVENGYQFFKLVLQYNGLDEKSVVDIWQDVLLFRRLFEDLGSSAALDPLAWSEFYAYANESATVEIFQLPPHLRFHTFEELKLCELYLDLVGEQRQTAISLPSKFAPTEQILQKAPELVGKKIELSIASMTKKGMLAKVAQKQLNEWELQPKNFAILKGKFPELAGAKTPFDAIDSLDDKVRSQVDRAAAEAMIAENPTLVKEALASAQRQDKELFLRRAHSGSPLPGIKDANALRDLLDKEDNLTAYTQDGEFYYSINVIKRSDSYEVLSYTDAVKEGILKEVAKRVDADALGKKVVKALLTDLKALGKSPEAGLSEEQLNNYAAEWRFARLLLDRNSEPFASEFKVTKMLKSVTRAEPSLVTFEQANSSSEVRFHPVDGLFICRFVEKSDSKTLPVEKLIEASEQLANETKTQLFNEILLKLHV